MDGAPDELGHAGVALEARHSGGFGGTWPGSFVQPCGGRKLDARFAERREHLVDIAKEGRVGADHEHPLYLEREAVGVQEVGGAVQGHGRLAGPRPALDDQGTGQRSTDDLVLFRLDGGDDVAHPARMGSLEGRQQHARPGQPERLGPSRPVALREELVLEVDDAAAICEEVAAPAQAHRARTRGPVERLGDRRPPVDYERLVLRVRDRQPADVEALVPGIFVYPLGIHLVDDGRRRRTGLVTRGALGPVDAPEDQRLPAQLKLLETVQPGAHPDVALGERLERAPPFTERLPQLGLRLGTHNFKAFVSLVNVGLLRRQVRVRHRPKQSTLLARRAPCKLPPALRWENGSRPAAVPCGVPGQSRALHAHLVHAPGGAVPS